MRIQKLSQTQLWLKEEKGGSSAGRGGGEAERASKRFGVEGWSAKALAC